MTQRRNVCWFSCGAASAVATKMTLKKMNAEPVVIVYQDTGSEHSDNKRFLKDCERWFGQSIQIIKSEKYGSIWDVFEKERYLVGIAGARCTTELKRKVAENFLIWGPNQDREILGYTCEESQRIERFKKNNPERLISTPLIDAGLNKADCFGILKRAKIELPEMYHLGYQNNNCIGCVKGGAGYWNRIRQTHPEVFARMAKVERKLNAAINKKYVNGERQRIFLDELSLDMGNYKTEPSISCGLFCDSEFRKMDSIEKND